MGDFIEFLNELKLSSSEKKSGDIQDNENRFRVRVETMVSSYSEGIFPETIERGKFNNEKDAKKFVKEITKKYKLIKHAGHIVNYDDGLELFTTF